MQLFQSPKYRALAVLMAACLIASQSGCGLLIHSIYWIKGNKSPAAFDGLEGKKVAVVCLTSHFVDGGDNKPGQIARNVARLLRKEVRDIKVVPQEEIADWMDRNNWDEIDYRTIGRGVNAELVVAIDLASFSIHDGQTLLKGKANAKVKVYDMTKNGEEVFHRNLADYQFPTNGVHTSDMSEHRFQQFFMMELATQIAKNFYPYELTEDFARDAYLTGV